LTNLEIDEIGDNHISTSINTPLRSDAFEKDDELKIELISKKFKDIMEILGLDLEDDSLQGTPKRVAKMYVQEIFSGLNPDNKPEVRLFENKYKFNEVLVEKNISFYSNCEHHFVPFFGVAHIAYIPKKHVVGLSKLNRTVQYYAKRPQVQERLTMQIANDLKEKLDTDNVAVIIEAKHLCVSSRGVCDPTSETVTGHYSGQFKSDSYKKEFLSYLNK
jgi:GTP cyclohydrolase I